MVAHFLCKVCKNDILLSGTTSRNPELDEEDFLPNPTSPVPTLDDPDFHISDSNSDAESEVFPYLGKKVNTDLG